MNAAEHYKLGVGVLGFQRKSQAVTREIGYVLHIGPLIIVGEDDCIAPARKSPDLFHQSKAHGFVRDRARQVRHEWLRTHLISFSIRAPRSGFIFPFPAGKILQNSFLIRLVMVALLLIW